MISDRQPDYELKNLREALQEWYAAESPAEADLAEELLICEVSAAVRRATARFQALSAHCEAVIVAGGPSDTDREQLIKAIDHVRLLARVLEELLLNDQSSLEEIIITIGGLQ